MQNAIRNYIELNKEKKSFDDIEKDIVRIGKSEIKRARKSNIENGGN